LLFLLGIGGRVGGADGIFDDGSICDDDDAGECDAVPFAFLAFSVPTLSSTIPETIS